MPRDARPKRLVVIGNPGSRRTALLAEAVGRFRGLSMVLVPWIDLLAGTANLRRIARAGDVVRIDSPGRDAAVERALLLLGVEAEADDGVSADRVRTYTDERGRILWPCQWYRGLRDAVYRVAKQTLGVRIERLVPDPDAVMWMFDKQSTRDVLASIGLPVPPASPKSPTSFDELITSITAEAFGQAFVKLRYGSSASGCIAIRFGRDQLVAYTTVEIDGIDRDGFPKLYNTRRIRRLTSTADVAAVVNALCPHGVVVERWLPKAAIDGKAFDLRVVVIDGKACHVVPRLSDSPMTNLHLLNKRGDVDRVRRAVGEAGWAEAMSICERAVAAFPGTLHAGVDLMFQPGFRKPTVLEVNAFGDLLPGVLHNGMDTYTAELAATFGPPRVIDAASMIGTHDVLLVTLDTLRYDVATTALAAGRTPHLAAVLPDGTWERRHTPGSFTYAAHHAFFAGFLPTPATPGRHDRLFAARFAGSETTAGTTAVFDAPDIVTGLAGRGYHTACIGGVGFFNKLTPLGSVLPGLFAESHWSPDLGVTGPASTERQVTLAESILTSRPKDQRLLLFLNVSAMHQPNSIFTPGATADTKETMANALAYADPWLGRLFAAVRDRAPTLTIICSDHGTAYGEDGFNGHRLAHSTVWDVPYAEFVL